MRYVSAGLVGCVCMSIAVAAPVMDRSGRVVIDADGNKTYFADAVAKTPIGQKGARLFAARPARSATLNGIAPPGGFPAFSGHGENFAFYDEMAYPIGSWPDTVVIADVDGDGRNDVVLATTYYFDPDKDYHIFVFLQQADGSLGPPTSYAYAGTSNTAGLLAMPVIAGQPASVLVGVGSGINRFTSNGSGFGTPVFYLGGDSQLLAGLDVDLDGFTDVVGISWSSGSTVYRSDGTGAFTTSTLSTGNQGYDSVAVRDIDGDGLSDLMIASGEGQTTTAIGIYWQTGSADAPGSGALSAPTTLGPPSGETIWYATAGDINRDGNVDIVSSRARNSPNWIWHFDGRGGHAFASAQAYPSYDISESIVVSDINRDGREDIITLHGGWDAAGLYLQASDGGMGVEKLFGLPYASHYQAAGLAVGDVNGDGCTDAVIADYNNGLVILYGHDCSDAIFDNAFD